MRQTPDRFGEALRLGQPEGSGADANASLLELVQHERILSARSRSAAASVHAEGGVVGRAEGLIVDLNDRQVTLVLLLHGHLWGAKSVSIPIDSITSLDFDGSHTSLPERDINALPEMRSHGTRKAAQPANLPRAEACPSHRATHAVRCRTGRLRGAGWTGR